MKIDVITSGIFQTNTYIISGLNESIKPNVNNNAVVIVDPGEGGDEIVNYLSRNSLQCTDVLLTHGHIDHIASAAVLQKLGAKVYIHEADASNINGFASLARANGIVLQNFIPDVLLKDGDEINISGAVIKVLHTPGHTAGGVCYVVADIIFSGDTLFYLSIGRSDLPGGNSRVLLKSIANLFSLQGDYRVLPGHNRETDLNFEKENNPYA